jgi:hypothetical protein
MESRKVNPNPRPRNLAEKLGVDGSPCPIPATHDRLAEVHYWWHEMAEWYHEPDPFRYRLGAFAQAARSVSLMLQTEKAAFAEFDWYDVDWVSRAKGDPVLKWLDSTRTNLFHRKSLALSSWLEMECFRNPRESPGEEDKLPAIGTVDPFQCTHYYINQGPTTDHGHNFTRLWSMEGLEGRELLSACAHIYDKLDELVSEAHQRLGASTVSYSSPGSKRRLPCMENIDNYRIVKTRMRKGKEVWINRPRKPHGN